MDIQAQLTYDVLQLLNRNAAYALLRNYEGLPENNRSKDIDIAILKKDFIRIRSSFIELVLSYNYKILTYYKSERMFTFICVDTKFDVLQFDFFFRTSIHGITLLKIDDLLKDRIFNGNFYHVSKEIEFLDKYIYLKVLNVQYPDKYKKTKDIVLENKFFDQKIKDLFHVSSYQKLNSKSGKCVLLKLLYNHVFSNISFIFLNLYYELVNLYNPQGISIAFTGPDGVGKTTVINNILDIISNNHAEVKVFHHRPTMIGNISNVALKTGVLKKIDTNYNEPHRGRKKNKLNSFLRLCYYAIDYVLGYWVKVRRTLYRRGFVIFDRYYTDIICDSRRTGIWLGYKFLYRFGRLFIPNMDYNILLTADSDIILSRKQELDADGIRSINEKIDYLTNKKGYIKILNETKPEDAVQKILSYIIEKQHKKNMKRL